MDWRKQLQQVTVGIFAFLLIVIVAYRVFVR